MISFGSNAIVSSVVSGVYLGWITSAVDRFILGLYSWANQWIKPEPLSRSLKRAFKERTSQALLAREQAKEAAHHPVSSLKWAIRTAICAVVERIDAKIDPVLRRLRMRSPLLGPPRELPAIEKDAGVGLGVLLQSSAPRAPSGVRVAAVTQGSLADGLLSRGDVLMAVNGMPLEGDGTTTAVLCRQASTLVLTVRSPVAAGDDAPEEGDDAPEEGGDEPAKPEGDDEPTTPRSLAKLMRTAGNLGDSKLAQVTRLATRIPPPPTDDQAMKMMQAHNLFEEAADKFSANSYRVGMLRDIGVRRAELRFRSSFMYYTRQAIAWLILWALSAAMCIIVIVYGALLGPEQTAGMAVGWCVSNLQSYVVMEPLNVCLLSCFPCLFDEESRLSRWFVYVRGWLQFLGFPV